MITLAQRSAFLKLIDQACRAGARLHSACHLISLAARTVQRSIVMSLVQSAKLNGHDPWAYLRDVQERLPSHLNSRINELLPHHWQNPAR
jgi:IS66 C-terminal element